MDVVTTVDMDVVTTVDMDVVTTADMDVVTTVDMDVVTTVDMDVVTTVDMDVYILFNRVFTRPCRLRRNTSYKRATKHCISFYNYNLKIYS
jgi:hypothetical protein